MTPEKAIKNYAKAWEEFDEVKRMRLLEQSWADEGVYSDPLQHAEGREALSRAIQSFQHARPGERIVMTSGVDHHHDRFRFAWQWADSNGVVINEGISFGKLAKDGRLQGLTAFFGPMPGM